jgi:diguanylate cyclase (GGDEF)-like protein/PAS domain S-box-containing protein
VLGPPHARFYAGVPLHSGRVVVGALCVMSPEPHDLTDADAIILELLARQAEQLMELQWRRDIEAPPQPGEVRDIAAFIHDEATFMQACANLHRPAWIYDTETLRFVAVNEMALEHYGWSRDRWLQMSILDLRPSDNAAVLESAIRNHGIEGYVSSHLWQHSRRDGSRMDVQVTTAPVTFDGTAARLVLVSDVTTRLHSQELLLHTALHDHLTGLPNRRSFLETVGASENLAVLIIGLDRFKLVNDTAGHETGDALLGSVAARIGSSCPHAAVIARLGGDEFAVAIKDATVLDAVAVADSVLIAVCEPVHIRGGEYYLSASIGIAVRGNDSTGPGTLAEADVAMYAAKKAGGRTVVVFDDDMRAAMAEWSVIQHDLHRAIERCEFELEYQPIFDFGGGGVSFEALLRWNHPVRGRLMPGAFVQIAEETGLIGQIGRWVMQTAGGVAMDLGVDISVNVSVHQFNDALVNDFERVMAEHGLRDGQLIVEVTESALADTHVSRRIIDGLRAAGARIWIDDFGTGYSSLSRLTDLEVDALKLDQSFIAKVDSAQGVAVAKTVVTLGRALGVSVIAEGIETEQQLTAMAVLGCQSGQGYHLGRPMSFDHAKRLVAEFS